MKFVLMIYDLWRVGLTFKRKLRGGFHFIHVYVYDNIINIKLDGKYCKM